MGQRLRIGSLWLSGGIGAPASSLSPVQRVWEQPEGKDSIPAEPLQMQVNTQVGTAGKSEQAGDHLNTVDTSATLGFGISCCSLPHVIKTP